PSSTLFPYTTLFRSGGSDGPGHVDVRRGEPPGGTPHHPAPRPDRFGLRVLMELVLPTAVTFAVVTVLILSLYHAITAEPVVSQRVRRLLGVQATRPEPAHREPGLLQRMLVAVGRAAGGAEPRLV